jgi:hypothetical protein
MPRVTEAPLVASPARTATSISLPSASATVAVVGVVRTRVAERKFIFGEPMKPATKRSAGRW